MTQDLAALADALEPMAAAPRFDGLPLTEFCAWVRQCAERDAREADAERYRWIAGHCRSTSEHWGGRWSIIVDGPCPTAHDEEDAFDAAIDAARSKEQK